VFYGYQMLNLTSVDNKGKLQGWLQVDSIKHMPAPIQHYSPNKAGSLIFNKALSSFKEQQANADQSLGIKLKPVEVKETRSRYVPYTQVIRITSQEHRDYKSLIQYLLFNLEGLETTTMKPARCRVPSDEEIPTLRLRVPSFWGAGFAVSGSYVDKSPLPDCTVGQDFLTLPMTSIVKVTIKRTTHTAGGFVMVEAKPGSLEQMGLFSKTTADVVGYYNAREFYSGNKQPPGSNNSGNTLLWQPNLLTDEHGKATITYNNSQGFKNVHIIIQGITGSGVPVYSTALYRAQ
jgi:hypothetical protein